MGDCTPPIQQQMKNCLEKALDLWKKEGSKIKYDGDHVINEGRWLPLEAYGEEHLLSSFTLEEKYVTLLKEYFSNNGNSNSDNDNNWDNNYNNQRVSKRKTL